MGIDLDANRNLEGDLLMKTFILASLLALTAASGVVAVAQPAAANTPVRTPERVDPIHPTKIYTGPRPICQCVGYPRPNPAGN